TTANNLSFSNLLDTFNNSSSSSFLVPDPSSLIINGCFNNSDEVILLLIAVGISVSLEVIKTSSSSRILWYSSLEDSTFNPTKPKSVSPAIKLLITDVESSFNREYPIPGNSLVKSAKIDGRKYFLGIELAYMFR